MHGGSTFEIFLCDIKVIDEKVANEYSNSRHDHQGRNQRTHHISAISAKNHP